MSKVCVRRGLGLVASFAIGSLALGIGSARADILTSLLGSPVADGSGGWFYTYTVVLTGTEKTQVSLGSSFGTIYDFGAIKTTAGDPTGIDNLTGQMGTFTFTTLLTNTPAPGISVTDNPLLTNIRFTSTATTPDQSGPQLLGSFRVDSASGPTTKLVNFDGSAFKDNPGHIDNNTRDGNVGSVEVPVPGPVLGGGLPGLLAACAGLIGLARRRRAKAAVAA